MLLLPMAMLLGFAVYFYFVELPELVRRENERVRSVYRAQVADAKEAGRGEVFDPAGTGAKRVGSIGREPYGFHPDFAWGWYSSQGVVRRVIFDPVERTNIPVAFFSISSLVLLLVGVLTIVGLHDLLRFVRDREDFLAATAHDLITPLVGMRYAISSDVVVARRLNERMIRLVENLKDFLALGGKRPPVDPVPVDIVACYREAYALFEDDYRDLYGGDDIQVSGVEDSVSGLGDETLIVQIFWNLLANDLKYAAPYGAVRVAFEADEHWVKVVFSDEGPGMSPRERHHAFDRYYRVRKVLESGKGGFGIGLCTAREFARRMGGDLVVESNTPKGCRFILQLKRP